MTVPLNIHRAGREPARFRGFPGATWEKAIPVRTLKTTDLRGLAAVVVSIVLHGAIARSLLPTAREAPDPSGPVNTVTDTWTGTTIDLWPSERPSQVEPAGVGAAKTTALAGLSAPGRPGNVPGKPARGPSELGSVFPATAVAPSSTKPMAVREKTIHLAADDPGARKPAVRVVTTEWGAESAKGPASGTGDELPAGTNFGSVGATGVRDLGRAFTRAIPPACDADPVWAALPPGDAGELEVAIRTNESGRITNASPTVGPYRSPPTHLVRLVRRTLSVLAAGTFALGDRRVSEGTQTLLLHATVTDAPAETPRPGGFSSLAFSFDQGHGRASFTRATGRRVDVTVEVIRVVPAPRR
jgi:hypothetical protein